MNAWLTANAEWIETIIWRLGEWSLRAAALLLAAWVITLMLCRRSAALRHAVWVAGVAGIVALPLLSAVLPGWGIFPKSEKGEVIVTGVSEEAKRAVARMVVPAEVESSEMTSINTPPAVERTVLEASAIKPRKATMLAAGALLMWWSVAGLLLGRLVFAAWRLKRIERNTIEAEGGLKGILSKVGTAAGVWQKPRLIFSQTEVMPMTWGFLSPRILLPKSAMEWQEREINTVLQHEVGHIRRGDWMTKMFSELVACVAWFHPLVWVARRALAKEQEMACDEWVVQKGTSATDYAETLVSLATRFARANNSCLGAALGWSGSLEARVRAIVQGSPKLSKKTIVLIACVVAALTVPIAAATTERKAAGTITEATAPQKTSDQTKEFSLTGIWIGANDSEGIWEFTADGRYKASFNGTKNDQAGTWKLEGKKLVLNDDSERKLEQLQSHSMAWIYQDGGKMRNESFRRKVKLPKRALETSEKELVGKWTGNRGMIPGTLTFKEDGTFESGSILSGPPISEGTWTLKNTALELVTLSDHDAERIGKTNRRALLELTKVKMVLFDRERQNERVYVKTPYGFGNNTGAEGTGEIRGIVVEGKKPLASAQVTFEKYEPKDGFRYEKEIITEEDGTFSANDLPPGKYRVSRLFTWDAKTDKGRSKTSTGTHSTLVEVHASMVTYVKIGGTGREIKGRLVPHVDLPNVAFTASDYRFLTLNEGANSHGGRHIVLDIKEDGTFTAKDVPPGEYKLFVGVKAAHEQLDAPDIATFSKTVVVPAGEGVFDLGFITNE